jgi:hypothetical protein
MGEKNFNQIDQLLHDVPFKGGGLSEKWIPQSLLPYGRDRTVARINTQIVSEWKYLFLHVIN